MVNELIQKELSKVEKADLTQFDEKTNTYFIPKRKDIKIEEDNYYLINIKDVFFNNQAVKVNWNNNTVPKYKYLKVEVLKIMAKMIKVKSIAFDYFTNTDINEFWDGWLPIDEISVLKKL